jgi:hypothetical protein
MDTRAVQAAPSILDPAHVPSLRALGLDSFANPDELQNVAEPQLSQLLHQVEALYVYEPLYSLAKDGLLAGLAPRILVDVMADDLENEENGSGVSTTIWHLRISTDDGTEERLEGLSQTLCFLKARDRSRSQLRSVYLDSPLRPATSRSPELQVLLLGLEQECEKGEVELIYELDQGGWLYNPLISEEFWRRQREQKRKGDKI